MRDRRIKLYPSAMNYYDNCFYFADLFSNTVYSFSLKNLDIKLASQFDKEICLQKEMFTSLLKGSEQLFFVPHSANFLGVYDLKNNTIKRICLPDKIRTIDGIFKQGLYHKGIVYLFGYGINNIWTYNTNLHTFEEIVLQDGPGVFMSGCIFDDLLFVVSKKSSSIWQIETNNMKSTEIKTDINDSGFADVRNYKDKLILTTYDKSKIYLYDRKQLSFLEVELDVDFSLWPHGGFADDIYGNYYVVSKIEDGLNIISEKRSIKKVELKGYGIKDNCICNIVVHADVVLIWAYECANVIIYNINDKTVKSYVLEIDNDCISNINISNMKMIPENQFFDLERFIAEI